MWLTIRFNESANTGQIILRFLSAILFLVILLPQSNAIAETKINKIRHSVKPLDLTRPPTTNELMAAGQLGGQLYPTEDIEIDNKQSANNSADKASGKKAVGKLNRKKDINLSFGKAIQEWNKHEYKKAVKMFRKHVEDYPDSPWASESVLHVGCDARYNGRYSEAEESFNWIVEKDGKSEHHGAKMLVNKARQRLGVLKVLQGNLEEAGEHFRKLKEEGPDWRQRTYAAHWMHRISRLRSSDLALYNCGSQALAYVLRNDGKHAEALRVLDTLPASSQGHSINDIRMMAEKHGYSLTGLRLTIDDLANVPLPAILQISSKGEGDSGHYWVLERVVEGELELFDPQSGRRFKQSPGEFSAEWAGNAIVFSEMDSLPGERLAMNQMERIFGGCCGIPAPEDQLGFNANNFAEQSYGQSCPTGAPQWFVNVININLYMRDIPLWYSSSVGPSVKIQLSYNSQSAIASNETFGNKWQFNYGSYLVVDTGGTVTIMMPDGRRDVYIPDGTGKYERPYRVYNDLIKLAENNFELHFPDGTVYVYNIPAGTSSLQPFLVEIRDAYGQSLTFNYNTDVELTSIVDAAGRSTNLTYNANGLVTQVTDPFGRSAFFEYDANSNLTKITDMGGYWTRFTYDADVYLTGVEDDRGAWGIYIEPPSLPSATFFGYSPPGSPMWNTYRITMTNPRGGKEEYFYVASDVFLIGHTWHISPRDYIEYVDGNNNNSNINVPKTYYTHKNLMNIQTGYGEVTGIYYPEAGNYQTADSNYIQFEYDSNGNRTSIKDAHGDAYLYSYNSEGRVTSITDPKGSVTNLTYADNDVDLIKIENGLGSIDVTYNSNHDVTSFKNFLGNTSTLAYNSYGQLTSYTDALGIVTGFTYDANRLKEVSRDGNALGIFTYDSKDRVSSSTNATGMTLVYDYNDLDNITKVTFPDLKSIDYTYSGCCPNLVDSVTDRAGRTTNYVYDEMKRIVEQINPEGGIIKYEYDTNGNLVAFIDPNGNTTSYEYNLNNQPVKKMYADGKFLSLEYDDAGLPLTFTNARGITTGYTYDANHNILTVSHSDSTPGTTYQYDDFDRVTQRQDAVGTYQYSYNANSQLTGIDGPWIDDTITYQYDPMGRIIGFSPQGGQSISYVYDTLNRLTGIQSGSGSFTYGYSGTSPLVKSLTRPNTSVTSYEYDLLNRLTKISNKDSASAIINEYEYAYNGQDMRSSETITNGTPITTFTDNQKTYSYNNVNQLLSSTSPAQAFTYDDDGNMTQGYTPEGYIFSAAYDAQNRLSQIEYTDGVGVVHKTEYVYSGNDFIGIEKKFEDDVPVNETHYVRGGYLPVQERDGSNNVSREYTWGLNMGGGIGGLLNLNQGGQDYSYLYDGKGNVTSLIDSSQAVAASYAYDPFGKLMTKTGALDQPFQFSTKQYDESLGISYYGYRFYSPALKRWITRDPISESGGINLYGFAERNPVNYVDKYGYRSKSFNGMWENIGRRQKQLCMWRDYMRGEISHDEMEKSDYISREEGLAWIRRRTPSPKISLTLGWSRKHATIQFGTISWSPRNRFQYKIDMNISILGKSLSPSLMSSDSSDDYMISIPFSPIGVGFDPPQVIDDYH